LPEKILVTSALPYANGPIHLGHLAGAYLPADIFVRYHRLKKNDVVYICGSDEHGVPIMLRARDEGVSPQQIVDRYHHLNERSFLEFGMSFDYYGRTSSKTHHQVSKDFFKTLADKDEFIIKKEEQLFDPEAGIFLADRFVRGTCPECGYDDAYGDQCEKCGTSLSPKELKEPRSAVTDATPILKETVHWYLPLSKYQKTLEKWIESHPEWKSNVLGQINSWFKSGLADRAVTRDLSWGVEVPEPLARKYNIDPKGKVLYVWFDAPIGYISATKEWAEKQGENDLWKTYWQNEKTRLVHFIGKDNIVFHCIIFPAMLNAHGKYVMPDNVPANEFLNLEGQKLSTSRNYAVWLKDYLEKFDPDSLRYTLAASLPEGRDSDFSWKEFQARHNNELADILGNFVNRSVTFVHKYYDGCIPKRDRLEALDHLLIDKLSEAGDRLGSLVNQYQFKTYTKELMDLCRFANKYFNDKEPWKARKENPQSCANTVNLCLQTTNALATLAEPLIPFFSEKLLKILNVQNELNWDDAGQLRLETGHKINQPQILFKKIEDKQIESEIERLKENAASIKINAAPQEEQQQIDMDQFLETKLKVGRIISAEPVKKANKLLKLQVDLGTETRQIIAGIAKHYACEDLPGKQVVVVANLKPAVLRGEKSEGMLLAADDGKKLKLITTMEDIENGSWVK
jgi:methionyl-tRNA synthetase